jgi:hypothetical protein
LRGGSRCLYTFKANGYQQFSVADDHLSPCDRKQDSSKGLDESVHRKGAGAIKRLQFCFLIRKWTNVNTWLLVAEMLSDAAKLYSDE